MDAKLVSSIPLAGGGFDVVVVVGTVVIRAAIKPLVLANRRTEHSLDSDEAARDWVIREHAARMTGAAFEDIAIVPGSEADLPPEAPVLPTARQKLAAALALLDFSGVTTLAEARAKLVELRAALKTFAEGSD